MNTTHQLRCSTETDNVMYKNVKNVILKYVFVTHWWIDVIDKSGY